MTRRFSPFGLGLWAFVLSAAACRAISSDEEGFGGGSSGSTPNKPQADEDGHPSPPLWTPVSHSPQVATRKELAAGNGLADARRRAEPEKKDGEH